MRHQIFKFSNDGKKLLMTLGEAGVRGNDYEVAIASLVAGRTSRLAGPAVP